jgi:8-oxo-dGTP pyrophosphatase MutT (NUDIX family)
VEQILTEIPAGVLEKNDATPLDGAKRELLEETGYGGGEWLELTRLSSNAANTNNLTHCFLARGVKPVDRPHFDPGEDIQCGLYTEEEVKGMLMRDEIVQSLMAAPLWKYFSLKAANEL